MRAVEGDGLPGVALVANPDVAVVVVRPSFGPLGQAMVAAATIPPAALVNPRSTA